MIGNSDLFGPSVAAASTMVKPEPGRDNITELECHNYYGHGGQSLQ